MEWNLFADGSLHSPQKHDGYVAGGWACILQQEETKQEIVCFGAEMTSPDIALMEIRGITRGLQLTRPQDRIRIFSDNLRALGTILMNAPAEKMARIFASIEPQEKYLEYMRELEDFRKGKGKSHDIGSFLAGARGEKSLLKELSVLVAEREIGFMKVSDMKQEKGRIEFATHARCDQIAHLVRRQYMEILGLPSREEDHRALLPWPFGPCPPETPFEQHSDGVR